MLLEATRDRGTPEKEQNVLAETRSPDVEHLARRAAKDLLIV